MKKLIVLVFVFSILVFDVVSAANIDMLKKYDKNYKQFKEFLIGNKDTPFVKESILLKKNK